jgi:phytoene synthase
MLISQKVIEHSIAQPSDYEACHQIMRAASRNYSFASAFLPKDKLHHVEALYALMRVGDDRVDVSHQGFVSALEAIELWEKAYWCAFEEGNSPHPVMRAYLQTSLECGIPQETMLAYFKAMKADLAAPRYATFSDLLGYVQGSAIPVGRAMTHILGLRPPYCLADALPGADSLAIAMQLSNFWRDVGYDWGIQRVYIPQADLERFNYSEADLAARRVTTNFIDLLEFEFARTEPYYEQARACVKMLASGRWAVMSGLKLYRAIHEAIRKNNYDVFRCKAELAWLNKLGLAAGALLQVAIAG